MNTWKTETATYLSRIEKLAKPIEKATNDLYSLGLVVPMPALPPAQSLLIIKLVLFVIGAARTADELVAGAIGLSREGYFTPTCLQIRLLYEYWGAVSFAAELGEKAAKGVGIETIGQKCERLTCGSRIPVRLPRGGDTILKSYNVMDFVRRLEKQSPNAMQEYEFLCEACHPSYIQQGHYWMAGATGDNWSNTVFRTHAHELLEKTVAAGERAAKGIGDACAGLCRTAKPYIDQLS